MALFSATVRIPLLHRPISISRSPSVVRSSLSLSLPATSAISNRRISISVRSAATPAAAPATGGVAPAISLTEKALSHLSRMRAEKSEDLCLRIGVRQGGCSGMSYTMEFESMDNARPDDSVMEFDGFVIVCDPKSLLFIYGMQLDFSDALIGGGFSFKNPNATQTCGCGKSFAAEM